MIEMMEKHRTWYIIDLSGGFAGLLAEMKRFQWFKVFKAEGVVAKCLLRLEWKSVLSNS